MSAEIEHALNSLAPAVFAHCTRRFTGLHKERATVWMQDSLWQAQRSAMSAVTNLRVTSFSHSVNYSISEQQIAVARDAPSMIHMHMEDMTLRLLDDLEREFMTSLMGGQNQYQYREPNRLDYEPIKSMGSLQARAYIPSYNTRPSEESATRAVQWEGERRRYAREDRVRQQSPISIFRGEAVGVYGESNVQKWIRPSREEIAARQSIGMTFMAVFCEGISRLTACVEESPYIQQQIVKGGLAGLASFGKVFTMLAEDNIVRRGWALELE